jgi:hypothetical protein
MYQDLPLLNDRKARAILQNLCSDHGITIDLLETLLSIQRDHLGKGKQIGISQEFSAALSDFLEENIGEGNAVS